MGDAGTVEVDDVKASRRSFSQFHDEILEVEIRMVDSRLVHFPHQPARLADEIPLFPGLSSPRRFSVLGEVANEINGVGDFPGNEIAFIEGPQNPPLYRSENLHGGHPGFSCHLGDDELPKGTRANEEEVPGQCSKNPAVFIMADHHPLGSLFIHGEAEERAPSLHGSSLISVFAIEELGIMDFAFHQPVSVDVPDDQLRLSHLYQGEAMWYRRG